MYLLVVLCELKYPFNARIWNLLNSVTSLMLSSAPFPSDREQYICDWCISPVGNPTVIRLNTEI
jgi:hypothetical protein